MGFKELFEEAAGFTLGDHWMVVLCPFTTKTRDVGRLPVLLDIDGVSRYGSKYWAFTLDGQRVGGAYLGPQVIGRYQRQHMVPGASIGGVGLGTTLYFAGSLRSAVEQQEDPLTACTGSPDDLAEDGCVADFGGGKLPPARRWWNYAVEKGFAHEADEACPGSYQESVEIPVDGEVQHDYVYEEIEEKINDPDVLESVKALESPLFFTREERLYAEEFDEDGDFSFKLQFVLEQDGGVFDTYVKEQAPWYLDDYEDIHDLEVTAVFDFQHLVEVEVTGTVSYDEDGDIFGLEDYDIDVEVTDSTINADVHFIASKPAIIYGLCGGELIDEYDMKLIGSEAYEDFEPAPPEVYAHMQIDGLSAEMLAALLADAVEESGEKTYALKAWRAMQEGPHANDGDAQEVLEDTELLLANRGLAPHPYQLELDFSRKANPSRSVQRMLMRKARKLQSLADIGDG